MKTFFPKSIIWYHIHSNTDVDCMVVTSANDSQKSANVLLMTFCKWSWARFNLLMRKCKWLSSLQMTFANGVLMSVPSFLWTATESTKHKKVEATVLMKHVRRKKQPVLKSDMRWKGKKERTSETANCISLQKRRYILCRKTLFTTKRLKGKKRQKGNIWTRWKP